MCVYVFMPMFAFAPSLIPRAGSGLGTKTFAPDVCVCSLNSELRTYVRTYLQLTVCGYLVLHIFGFTVSLCDSSLSWCVQNNLVAKRGLGSDSDDQVYEVAFTDSFRKYFNSILLSSTSDVSAYV